MITHKEKKPSRFAHIKRMFWEDKHQRWAWILLLTQIPVILFLPSVISALFTMFVLAFISYGLGMSVGRLKQLREDWKTQNDFHTLEIDNLAGINEVLKNVKKMLSS